MIHDEICTYEVAKLAKEKGFPLQKVVKQDGRAFFYELPQSHPDWANCDAWYLPTQSLLQRWLRKERGIIVEVFMDDDSNMPLTYNIHQYKDWNWECVCHHHGNYYAVNDWELCLEDALKYALENLI